MNWDAITLIIMSLQCADVIFYRLLLTQRPMLNISHCLMAWEKHNCQLGSWIWKYFFQKLSGKIQSFGSWACKKCLVCQALVSGCDIGPPRTNNTPVSSLLVPRNGNENIWILIEISLICVSKHLIGNKSALVQVITWCHQATNHKRAITSTSVDQHLCHLMASLGHDKFKWC